MIHPKKPAELDLDEDLFDFAGVAHEPEVAGEENLEEIFASFRDTPPPEELLSVPVAAGSAPARSGEPSAARPAQAQAAAARAPNELMLAPRSRLTKGVVVVALAVTALNSVLAVVLLRGRAPSPAPEHAAPDAGENAAHAAPPSAPVASVLPDPETRATLHSHPALDEARAEISRGEFAAARKRVYGLLSIIDRLDDPRRAELEADCQFLIAQALHLEALARMGGAE
ncbi:MAG: hypothetical protein EXS08_11430 [Planctomycetes bacterium]|nr:hypothetical protein [Planctomycetota bacterium]